MFKQGERVITVMTLNVCGILVTPGARGTVTGVTSRYVCVRFPVAGEAWLTFGAVRAESALSEV